MLLPDLKALLEKAQQTLKMVSRLDSGFKI